MILKLVSSLFTPTRSKREVCRDHIYYPVYGDNREPLGQECKLCGDYNSAADLGIYIDPALYKEEVE